MKSNKVLFAAIFLQVFLMMAVFTPASGEYVQGKTFMFYTGNDPAHWDINGFYTNYTGNTILNSSDADLTADLTADVDALFFPGNNEKLSTAELAAVKTWFDGGNKLLWVAGESDYGSDLIAGNINPILEEVDSVLRIDAGSIEDPVSSDGSAYRVIATGAGTGTIATEVFSGITNTSMIFHGPTSVYAIVNDTGVDLRSTDVANVEVLISATEDAIILDNDVSLGDDDFYYGINETLGEYPMWVVETMGENLVVTSGESIFTDYKNMYGNTLEKSGTYHANGDAIDNLIQYFFDNFSPADDDDAAFLPFDAFAGFTALAFATVLVVRRRK